MGLSGETSTRVFSNNGKLAYFALSQDGSLIARVSYGSIILSDLITGEIINTIKPESGWNFFFFTPDNLSLAFLDSNHTLSFYDLSSNQLLHFLQMPPDLLSVYFSEDGKYLIIMYEDLSIEFWGVNP
jgi:WD40 repeat protein